MTSVPFSISAFNVNEIVPDAGEPSELARVAWIEIGVNIYALTVRFHGAGVGRASKTDPHRHLP